MQDSINRFLLDQMDQVFTDYCREADRLRELLSKPLGASSWTLYHDLQRQRVAESIAYGKYRKLQDELFDGIAQPVAPHRPESSVA
ncbi:MAG TPA: hypothetical protein VMB02_17030 [Candidatus Aquilonibacter sp.]|nr:hypothetical protein [Candidatus Aquilonibacter sp.]